MLCEREGFSATSKTVRVMLLSQSDAPRHTACCGCMLQVGLKAFCIRMCLHIGELHALPHPHRAATLRPVTLESAARLTLTSPVLLVMVPYVIQQSSDMSHVSPHLCNQPMTPCVCRYFIT